VRDDDLVDVAAIHHHYIEDTLICVPELERTATQWQEFTDDLRARGLPFLVAERQQVVGYAYVHPWKPGPSFRHTGEVTIYLAPGHTDHQIGQALLEPLLAASQEAGISQLIGAVAETAAAPRTSAFCQKYAFEECGLLQKVAYRDGQWVDLRLYQRQLATPCGSSA
jgi:phosphinothricin acetyltransferase